MTRSWRFSYETARYDPGPDAIEVTALGGPVRSFIPAARDLSAAELAEFRKAWLSAGPPVTGVPAPPDRAIADRVAARRRGQCQGCGLDDEVDIRSRCRWCAELAALKARNLPGPRLSGWWMTVPAALALALLTLLAYAVASVILVS